MDKLEMSLAVLLGNGQEQKQAVVPAVQHRLQSPLQLRTFTVLFSCKGKC